MIDAILVEHTVRVVHPSVRRRKMVCRAIRLFGKIITVCHAHLFCPHCRFAGFVQRFAFATGRRVDVESIARLHFIRHTIVDLVVGKTHENRLFYIIIVVDNYT